MTARRILVVDPYPITREGIIAVISASLAQACVTGCSDIPEALTYVHGNHVDLVIIDFRVRGDNALSLLREMKGRDSWPRCLILSTSDEMQTGFSCIRAGASGYLEKSAPVVAVVAAVRDILAGRIHVSERLSQALITNRGDASEFRACDRLTKRELQIFSHIGEGLAVSDIALKLGISVKTVEAHRENMKNKLNCHSATEVVATAVRWMLTES